jgi:hypothetical protein
MPSGRKYGVARTLSGTPALMFSLAIAVYATVAIVNTLDHQA